MKKNTELYENNNITKNVYIKWCRKSYEIILFYNLHTSIKFSDTYYHCIYIFQPYVALHIFTKSAQFIKLYFICECYTIYVYSSQFL